MSAEYNINDLCYLCSKPFGIEKVNEDHIFQQQFIRRKHPKAKGFNYAGTLLAHENCNNSFGGAGKGAESICKKALHLLEILYSPNTLIGHLRDLPIVAINSSSLPEFTSNDVAFFKFNDTSNLPYKDFTSSDYFSDKEKINPFRIPTNIALSTLAKSTAGFLIKRFGYPQNSRWRILAIPYYAEDDDFSFDEIMGNVKPLEVGIKVWIKPENNGWLAVYKFNRFLVYFCFEPTASTYFQQLKKKFVNIDCLFFESDKLIDLINYDWGNYPL